MSECKMFGAGSGAYDIVVDKWTKAQDIANDSISTAMDALDSIISTVDAKVQDIPEGNLGNISDVDFLTDVTYNAPEEPPLPNLTYPGSLDGGNGVTFGGQGQGIENNITIGEPPTWEGGDPPGFGGGITFTPPFALGPFGGNYTPPGSVVYNPPGGDPGAFSETYTTPPSPTPDGSITRPPDFDKTPPEPGSKNDPVLYETVPRDAPTINIPTYPDDLTPTYPEKPIVYPVEMPTIYTPDLSEIDAILAQLQSGKPTAPNLSIPDDYVLDVFNQLKQENTIIKVLPVEEVLTWMLAGDSIGIPANVALMLRDRAFAAEDRQAFQALDEAYNDWLSRGFALPGGALEAKLAAVRQLNRDKKAELNRNLWVEEAKLEIEALREAIKMGIQYQSALWDAQTKLLSVCGELASRFLDTQIKVLEVSLAVYRAKMEAWQVEASVLKEYLSAKLQSELSKLENTKIEAEITKLQVQINQQEVELYKAGMEGVMAEVSIYKAQIDAANGKLQAESLKLEVFAKKIQAYSAAVQAYEAEWRGYAAAVQADNAKTDAFKAQVQAYAAQVDAYARELEADKTRITAELEIDRFGLEAYKTKAAVHGSKVEMYGRLVDAEKTRMTAEIEAAKLPLEAYKAQAQAYSSKADAYGRAMQAEGARVQAEAEIAKLPTEFYKAATQAYAARVDGFSKLVDAYRAETTAQVEMKKLDLESFRLKLDNYKAELQRAGIEVESKAKVHNSQIQLFGSLIESEKARVNAEIQNLELRLRKTQFEAGIELKNAELGQTKALELAKMALQGQTSVASVAQQLAGAALSAVSAQAQIGSTFSQQDQVQCQTSYNYNMSS